jgi:aryl-alcohol dehydrogenase-like predicted oxidoreductase
MSFVPFWQRIWGEMSPEEEAVPLLKKGYGCGINTWVTADMYSDGVSKIIIGKYYLSMSSFGAK